MASDMWGIDVAAAPGLITALQSWTADVDIALANVHDAETLSDMPVLVDGPLLDIATDGHVMSASTQAALDELLGHELTVQEMVGHEIVVPALFAAEGDSLDRTGPERNGRNDERADRIDELIAGIAADTAAGRDSGHRFTELNEILLEVIGDEDNAAWASSLLAAGVPAAVVIELFADGPDALNEQIMVAMESGQSPEDAGLPAELFPDEYVEWHRLEAEEAVLQAEHDDIQLLWESLLFGDITDPDVAADLRQRIGWYPPDHPAAVAVGFILDGHPTHLLTDDQAREIYNLADSVADDGDRVQAKIDAINEQQDAIRVPTLDGTARFDDDGRLSTFDAIGATAVISPVDTSSFVGTQYAEHIYDFDTEEVTLATARVADNEVAATAFFVELGPEATGTFLTEYQFEDGRPRYRGDVPIALSPIAENLGTALGVASPNLPPGYATAVITAESETLAFSVYNVEPEWLFAHGDYDPDFLLEAGEATLVWRGEDRWGPTKTSIDSGHPDPRSFVLGQIADDELGADLVERLDENGTIQHLIWASPPNSVTAYDPFTNEPTTVVDPETGIESYVVLPPHVQIILQAGLDDGASSIIIDSAGSQNHNLHIDVANAVSQVLAGQVDNFVGSPHDAPYFVAVQNVFEAGAGYDLDLAAQQALNDAIANELQQPNPDWSSLGEYGEFIGHIDGRKFIVFHDDAQARDAAIRNTQAWIGGIANTIGISATVIALPFTGGGSAFAYAAGGTGVTAAVVGWVLPSFLDSPDNVEAFLAGEIDSARLVDQRGEATVLLPAIQAGLVESEGGNVIVTNGLGDDYSVTVIAADGTRTTINIDPNTTTWVDDFKDLANQTGVDLFVGDQPLEDFLDIAGDQVFSDPYDDGHIATTGSVADGYE